MKGCPGGGWVGGWVGGRECTKEADFFNGGTGGGIATKRKRSDNEIP